LKQVALIFFLLLATAMAQSNVESDFKSAISLYDQARFAESVGAFQQLIERGYSSPPLFYNIGCAYFKSGQLGLAIANFRRAQRLLPEDEDIKANLQFAQLYAVDKIEATNVNVFSRLAGHVMNWLSPNQYLAVSLFAVTILFGLLALSRIGKLRRAPTGIVALLGIIAILSGGAMVWTIQNNYLIEEGVITVEQTDIMSGPGTQFELQFEAHEGLMFQILDTRQDYYLGLFANQLKGWVRRSDVVTI
jgi:tetratricopeptide (TPR) repeat protein